MSFEDITDVNKFWWTLFNLQRLTGNNRVFWSTMHQVISLSRYSSTEVPRCTVHTLASQPVSNSHPLPNYFIHMSYPLNTEGEDKHCCENFWMNPSSVLLNRQSRRRANKHPKGHELKKGRETKLRKPVRPIKSFVIQFACDCTFILVFGRRGWANLFGALDLEQGCIAIGRETFVEINWQFKIEMPWGHLVNIKLVVLSVHQ